MLKKPTSDTSHGESVNSRIIQASSGTCIQREV